MQRFPMSKVVVVLVIPEVRRFGMLQHCLPSDVQPSPVTVFCYLINQCFNYQ